MTKAVNWEKPKFGWIKVNVDATVFWAGALLGLVGLFVIH